MTAKTPTKAKAPAKTKASPTYGNSLEDVISYLKKVKKIETDDEVIEYALRYTSKVVAAQVFLDSVGKVK